MQSVDVERLVFLDECGITTAMTRTHGWGPRGVAVVGNVPRNRGRVTTVISAMDLDGPIAMLTIDRGTDTDTFLHFLRAALLPELEPGRIIVLDNLGAHHAKRTKALCEQHGVELRFLPAYSPELNPIELYWSWFKHELRNRGARRRAELDDAAAELFHAARPEHARAFIRACGYPLGQPT
jgi:transposase